MLQRGVPSLPAVRKVTLHVHELVHFQTDRERAFERMWRVASWRRSVARTIEREPLLEIVAGRVRKVNKELRVKMPATREIVWDLERAGRVRASRPSPDKPESGVSAEQCVKAVIVEAGCWRACEGDEEDDSAEEEQVG